MAVRKATAPMLKMAAQLMFAQSNVEISAPSVVRKTARKVCRDDHKYLFRVSFILIYFPALFF